MNGAAFVIDKTLLRKSFRRPATYAAIIGMLGILAVVLLPFGAGFPSWYGWLWVMTSGTTFPLSLWLFFTALARGEATRVVPVVGSLIPILTLAGTSTFLGERLTAPQYGGFALLILATIILSGAGTGAKGRLTPDAILAASASAFFFAVSFITVKIGYDTDGFMTTFTYSRFMGIAAAVIILAIDRDALTETRNAFFPKKTSAPKKKGASLAVALVLLAQTLGAFGFVLVQYAISQGSAAIVNSLQAVQYVFLVLAAFVFAKQAPTLLGEELTTSVVLRKIAAILLVAAGLWLVV
jgi:drug/metabolite transporter (DMT)-like permease